MNLTINKHELLQYIDSQTQHFFPDRHRILGNREVKNAFEIALERTEECFDPVNLPNYHDEKGNTLFSHMHSDQYATLIYYFSNTVWKESQNRAVCDKLMLLNRVLFSIFISYKNDLPNHFLLIHAFGTILGNARYNDYLVAMQGVTINTAQDKYGNPAPVLGKGLYCGANSSIIGNKPIGDRVSLGINTLVYNTDIPDDSVVCLNNDGSTSIRKRVKETCAAQRFFNCEII